MKKKLVFILALSALAPACDNITGPSYPDVAGTYSGPLVWSLSIDPTPVTGTMSITVVQQDSQLTVTGSITMLGTTSQLPAITGTINETGFFTATSGGAAGNIPDPTCGVITTTSSTLTFSGNSARFHETASTQYCGSWSFDATLTR